MDLFLLVVFLFISQNKMLKLKISLCLQLWEKDSELLMASLKSIRVGEITVLLRNVYMHTHRILMCDHAHLAMRACGSKTITMQRVEPVLKLFQ